MHGCLLGDPNQFFGAQVFVSLLSPEFFRDKSIPGEFIGLLFNPLWAVDVQIVDDDLRRGIEMKADMGGTFMGHAPTGKRIEIDVIDIARFKDGKIVEHWGVADRLKLLQQLELIPVRPAPETPAT